MLHCFCCYFALDIAFTVLPPKAVISTEATHSLTVSCAVERPPHFALAVACSCRPLNHPNRLGAPSFALLRRVGMYPLPQLALALVVTYLPLGGSVGLQLHEINPPRSGLRSAEGRSADRRAYDSILPLLVPASPSKHHPDPRPHGLFMNPQPKNPTFRRCHCQRTPSTIVPKNHHRIATHSSHSQQTLYLNHIETPLSPPNPHRPTEEKHDHHQR